MQGRRPILPYLLVLGMVLLSIFFAPRLFRKPPTAEPDMTSLKESLQKTAEIRLPAPDLLETTYTLLIPEQDMAAEKIRIVSLASKLGGTAIPGEGSAPVTILVQIPAANASKFIKDAAGKEWLPTTTTDDPISLEIVLEPKPGATP